MSRLYSWVIALCSILLTLYRDNFKKYFKIQGPLVQVRAISGTLVVGHTCALKKELALLRSFAAFYAIKTRYIPLKHIQMWIRCVFCWYIETPLYNAEFDTARLYHCKLLNQWSHMTKTNEWQITWADDIAFMIVSATLLSKLPTFVNNAKSLNVNMHNAFAHTDNWAIEMSLNRPLIACFRLPGCGSVNSM